MQPDTKPCPDCGGTMHKEHGTINEPVMLTLPPYRGRQSRPATFYACGACEHCEEVA